jgi:DNA-directed RNA polymerase specialized sigma24 family protein
MSPQLASGEPAIDMPELKKNWTLSPEAFRRLLDWLDDGSDSAGERYLEMRRRLTAYFDRKNCLSSDELADETLNRVARKLEEKGAITEVSVLHYSYIVAKFVFLENLRRARPIQTGATELLNSDSGTHPAAGVSEIGMEDLREKTFGCLERCLDKLQPQDRELILDYYRGERRAKIERRSDLAARLGLTVNALSIRACRIRSRLEICVSTCAKQK